MPELGGRETTYISDEGSNTVSSVIFIGSNYGQTSGPSIQSQAVLGFTGLVLPSQVAADGNGDVWVLDQGAPSGGSRVVRLDSSGNQTVPYTASAGDPLGLVQDVAAFAVDGPQDLYLGGSHNGSGVIVKIDPLGLETQVASGIGVPAAMAVDALYTVYTVDASTGTLLKIDRLGNKTTLATGLPAPTEISLDPAGTVYLSSATGKGVLTIAPDGKQKTLVLAGIANPAIAVADYFGNIQVADGVTKLPYVASRFNVNVNFGSVAPNASATQDFAISNIGNLSAGALTPSLQQGTYAPFSATPGVTNGCQFSGTGSPTLLAPAQSCHIQFQYSPTKAGTDTAIATVSASNPLGGDSGAGTSSYWELSGTASAAAPAPVPVLTPSALDFGSLTVGTSSSAQTATLSNTGNAALTVSSIAITGANAGSFSETNTCGASVAASASCSIAVTCKPSAAGEQTATLAANYPSPLAQQTVALTCDGTAATAPVAALTPASLSFTTVAGSTPAAQTATLTNSGNAALAIGSISIGGANAASFTQTNTCGASLAAGANCAITVSFAGTTVGSYAAKLAVTDNSATPTQTAALSATVTDNSAPAAALTPASLTYSATAGATSAAQTATLTNSGNATLNISGITLTGANASDFALSAKTCGATLASGASCTISVTFTPNAAGSFAAAISVADDAPGSPQTSALSGTGTAAPAAPDFTVTATPATQSVSAGSAATYTVSVASTGGSFTSAVALTAAGLPSGMTVAFSPASVTPGAGGGQSIMTVQTAVQQTASSRQPPQGRFSGAMAAPAFAAVLLLIPGWRARRRWNSKAGRAYFTGAGCLLILLGMMGAITGCGGGFALPQASATSYTITVTGTSGSVQHSTSVQITVR